MKLIVFTSSLILVQAVINNDEVIISGVRYKKEVLYINIVHPNSMCIHYSTNYLYLRIDGNSTARLDLDTKELRHIEGVSGIAGTLTVNQQNKDVFIGTTEGIYKYNPIADKSEIVGLAGRNIWNLYYKGVLYYNEHDTSGLYSFNAGQSIKFLDFDVSGSVWRIFIDKEDSVYFNINSVMYKQKKGAKAVVLYYDFVNAVIEDRNGKVYFSTVDGIYEILKDDKVKKVFSANVYGLAIDGDNNLIYSDETKIYRLKRVLEIGDIKKEIINVYQKIDNVDKNIENLQKIVDHFQNVIASMEIKIDRQLSNILDKLSQRTECNPRTIHLDIDNIPVRMDDSNKLIDDSHQNSIDRHE